MRECHLPNHLMIDCSVNGHVANEMMEGTNQHACAVDPQYRPDASYLLQDPAANISSPSAWLAWMARVQRRRGCGSFLWEEPSNYYVKAFSGWGRAPVMRRKSTDTLSRLSCSKILFLP